jgi:hypothetical protein
MNKCQEKYILLSILVKFTHKIRMTHYYKLLKEMPLTIF